MVDMSKILLQLSAYEYKIIKVNGKEVYIGLYYQGLSFYSFKITDGPFGKILYKGKTIEELENYLNML